MSNDADRVPAGPLLVGALGTEINQPAGDHADLFRRQRAIVCRDLLEPKLLGQVLERCRSGTFAVDHVDRIGSREVESPQRAGRVLNLALSRPALLRWVEAATGCVGLQHVEGRVVQTRPNGVDGLDWHDDMNVAGRRLGITINLSDAAYVGGDFELRSVTGRVLMTSYHHDRAGTALIFDVQPAYEHRVLPLISGGPRRVYTGWFMHGTAPSPL